MFSCKKHGFEEVTGSTCDCFVRKADRPTVLHALLLLLLLLVVVVVVVVVVVILLLVFIPWANLGRNQSPVMRPV